MRVLALDTTTRAGSVAVVDDGRVLVERTGDAARTHAERLPAEIIDALAAAGLTIADVELFAVASGPGSFTGLRIGIATIQGLAFVTRRRVVPVSALRALAEAAASGRPAGTRVGAWMDAHRLDVFSALYEIVAPSEDDVAVLREVEPPMVAPPGDVLERWTALGPVSAVCGDGATMYANLLGAEIDPVHTPPLAGLIGRLATAAVRDGHAVDPAGVQPLYVRRPDAEVARDRAHLKR
jgi:tRNA threonylcarbamoyladenosine biosynthesis protein TsaB